MSNEGGDTRKGIDDSRPRPIRVAKALEPAGSWRTDSGAINLDLDGVGGSTPSGSGGKGPSLMDRRRERGRRTAAPWWIWVAFAVAMLIAIVLMTFVALSGVFSGGEATSGLRPPSPPAAVATCSPEKANQLDTPATRSC